MPEAYRLAIVSHKGGTGRTTAALALAWCLGQQGKRVLLIDADPVHSAALAARNQRGECPWQNVEFAIDFPPEFDPRWQADMVLIDAPSLMDPSVYPVLAKADGVLLTALADPLSLRTIPAAASALSAAQAQNPHFELLGLFLPIYNAADELQDAMLARLREQHGDLLLEPPVPLDSALRDRPLDPGSDLPEGPATAAYHRLARGIADWIRAPLASSA